tara:strand:- start:174 stop:737 length:564 start_codon:yes stop_codon:yes gene_type:complete
MKDLPGSDAAARKSEPGAGAWLSTLRRYLLFVAAGNLVWESAHIPLYTIWETGDWGEIIFAVVHCTGGDILIALSAIVLSLLLAGRADWPASRFGLVLVLTVLFGVTYTVFSEWLNIEVRQAWAYRGAMPVIPVLGAGLSPVLQWILVPLAGFWWAMRPVSGTGRYRETKFTAGADRDPSQGIASDR